MGVSQVKLDLGETVPEQRLDSASKRLTKAFDRLEKAVKIYKLRHISLSAEREKLQVALHEAQGHCNDLQAVNDEIDARLARSLGAVEAALKD